MNRFLIAVLVGIAAAGMAAPPAPAPSAPSATLVVLEAPLPTYPEAWRKAAIAGEIHVRVVVGPSGVVTSAKLERGLERQLDNAMLVIARQWRFNPAPQSRPRTALLEFAFQLFRRRPLQTEGSLPGLFRAPFRIEVRATAPDVTGDHFPEQPPA